VVTDKTDARELTLNLDRYLGGNLRAMSEVRVPTPAEEQRRALSRQREQLRRERQRLAAQGRSLCLTQRGSKSRKGLEGARSAVFPFVGTLIRLSRCPYQFHPWKLKTGDPNFRTAGKSFIAHSARLFTRPRAVLGQRIFESNKLTVADNYLPARST
jgi:hypothetical protein